MTTLPPLEHDPGWPVSELGWVRDMAEYHTNGSPFTTMGYTEYVAFAAWCQWPDKLEIIRSTVLARLALPVPTSTKALFLAQVLPSSSLPSLLEPLGKLAAILDPCLAEKADAKPPEGEIRAPCPDPLMHSIARSLIERGEKEKKEKEDKEAKEAKEKWELWAGLYGRTKTTSWVGIPQPVEPEWGWYGMWVVPVDEWWGLPEEGEGK